MTFGTFGWEVTGADAMKRELGEGSGPNSGSAALGEGALAARRAAAASSASPHVWRHMVRPWVRALGVLIASGMFALALAP